MTNSLQLSNIEMEMMREVFQVFSKYKSATREFGVQLVHEHFPLNKGEILYETHDSEKRTLSIQPIELDESKIAPLATAWKQSEIGQIAISLFCCDSGGTVVR